MENSKMTMPETASIPLQSQSSTLEQNILANLEKAEKNLLDCFAESQKEKKSVEKASPKIVKKLKANWTLPIPPPLPPNSIGAICRRQQLEKDQQDSMESQLPSPITETLAQKESVMEVSRKIRANWKLPIPPPLPKYAIEQICRCQQMEKQQRELMDDLSLF